MPNLGDFTKIDVSTLGRVDILAGGTPCQAFSVAGLRQSLADARGNLSLEFVRLAHELADRNGLRNVVWENVVGVLSTKDNAFGCFLAGLVGADAAIEPPRRGKWPGAGMVSGPKGRAAWRVLDAQYFGVAQRRRRVIVVADFGNGADPAAVLFEQDGVRRHSPPSREAGKDAAAAAGSGAGAGGEDRCLTPWDSQQKRIYDGNADVAPTLSGSDGGGGRYPPALSFAPEIARCVATREGSSQDYETTTMVAVGVHGDIAHTLKAEGADASEDGTGRGTPVIAFSAKDYGADASFDIAPTLRAGGHTTSHANAGVMPAIAFNAQMSVPQVDVELSQTLQAKNPQAVAQSVAIRGRDGGATAELGGEVATALRASQGGGDKPHVLTSAVRRLTPKECERLQGFWDNYTRVPIRRYKVKKVTRTRPEDMWEKINGEWWLMAADGPRYKALGNSWAVPKFAWLGLRIQRLMPAASDATNDNVAINSQTQIAA